jgi:hypothetical protein
MKSMRASFTVALLSIGLMSAVAGAATYNVPGDYPTIQAAISSVTTVDGDIIVVAPGTYAENLILNKSLTLRGVQSGVAGCGRVAGPPNPATESIITGPAPGLTLLTLVTGSAGSTIDGFSFIGGTRGIESNTGPIHGLSIRCNHFAGFTGAAVFLNDPGTDVTVDRNNMNGASKTATGGTMHLDTDNFNGFFFTNNCVVNAPNGPGLFVDGNHNVNPSPGRAPTISGNLFEGHTTNVGLNLGSRSFGGSVAVSAVFSNNIIRLNAFDGVQGGIQRTAITGNQFRDNGRWGLALTSFGNLGADRGGQFNTITQNTFAGNDSAGYFISATQAPGNAASNVANFNDIVGNGDGPGGLLYGVIYRGSETIDVKCNWWGHFRGPRTSANPTSPGDGLFAPSALYIPWLDGSISGAPTCTLSDPTPGNPSSWGSIKARYR